MPLTRGEFLKSLGKSLPGLVASTGVATAAEALFRRVAQAAPAEPIMTAGAVRPVAEEPVPFFTRGRNDDPVFALTFDDGPEPGVTELILDALRTHQAQAAFFMIGEKVAAAPELARRVIDEGHELGHHTYFHPKLTELSDAALEQELDRTQAVFQDALGQRASWFRPPFGALRQDQARRVRDRAMAVAMWSLDSEDWRDTSATSIHERIVTHLHPGAVVLCHDVSVTATHLDALLKQIRDTTSLTPVPVGELARRVG